tara:strand:+ start:475 stop:1482 length:1008 start_codon:yes stop_codon:yes gene_type:complete
MSKMKNLRYVIRSILLESEAIHRGRRKTWRSTETEEDYTGRVTDPEKNQRAHNRAASGILRRDRVSSDEHMQDIAADAQPIGIGRDAETKFKFNVNSARKKIWAQRDVSNWQRLKLRQLWQDAVYSNTERAAFWSDSNKVHCVHGLQMLFSGKKINQIKKSITSLENLISRSNSGDLAELSCLGLSENQSHHLPGGGIAIEFLEREIVWASKEDSWTQFLSSADENTKEYFQMMKELESLNPSTSEKIYVASLVKFPSTRINPEDILFSVDDFVEFANGYAKEVIIRNYTVTPESIIIRVNKNLDEEILKFAEEELQKLAKESFGDDASFNIIYV